MDEDTKAIFIKVIKEVGSALTPLSYMKSEESVRTMLLELGWELPDQISITDLFSCLSNDLLAVEGIIKDVEEAMENNSSDLLSKAMDMSNKVCSLIRSIEELDKKIETMVAQDRDFLDNSGIKEYIAKRLVDYLVVTHLQTYYPRVSSIMAFVGIMENEETSIYPPGTDGNGNDKKFILRTLNWERLSTIFSNPLSLPNTVYEWGENEYRDPNKLVYNILRIFEAFDLSCGIYRQDSRVLTSLHRSLITSDPLSDKELRIPLYQYGVWPDSFKETGLNVFPLPGDGNNGKAGIAVMPYIIPQKVNESIVEDIPLGNNWQLNLEMGMTADLVNKGYGISLRPNEIKFMGNILNGNPNDIQGNIQATIALTPTKDKLYTLLGSSDSTYLGLKNISFLLEVNKSDADFEIGGRLDISEIRLVIAKGDGDGFIQKILPDKPVTVSSSLELGISKKKGFYVSTGSSSSTGFEYTFQINKTLGPITVTTLDLRLETKEETISLITTVSANAEIGPVSASVEKIGLEAMLDFSKKGALGNADIAFGFKPPTGVGLSIDASVIKGGGYLSINDGNYAGILQLEIANKVSITAIGILTTHMPDGTKIFSLKFLGMVEFPPVQLGYGIFLNGVGLAVAIHCSMNAEALRNSVYAGSLNSLLFPPDPIKNAVKIISDLQSFFPPEEGCYSFGVMAKLGWGGVKALVQAEVGVFIELANGKFRKIVLAGIAKCILPTDDNQILHIEFQVIGIIDFSNDTFSIDASLEKSFILIYNLDGDIALRACWGDNPRFALSMGGFYPGFVAPNNFPQLRRMSISLGSDNPRIGLLSYMAITENSVQIGAALLFHYEKKTSVGYFEVDGGMGFDALFEFNPFYFETKMCAYLALKRNHKDLFNIKLDLTLSGPNNWHAVGYAKFEVLCVDVTLSFDETFGEKRPEIPPPVVSLLEALTSELIDRHNWSVLPPKYGAGKVMFRKNAENEPYVDPFGEICFRQKSIPFGINIEKYGNSDINPDECYFEIKPDITYIGSNSAPDVKDEFSPGSYKKLTDQEKISAKAFEQMNSGFKISVDKVELGSNKENNVIVYGKDTCYNTMILPNSGEKPTHGGFVMPQSLTSSQFITGQKYYNRFNAKSPSAMNNRIVVKEQKFAVISSKAIDGKFKIDNVGADISYAQAAQLKKNKASTNFHIVCASRAVIV